MKLRNPKNPWRPNGPALPLEFSRVSVESRSGALTLVVDESGAETATWYAVSARSEMEDTICDLRCREGTVLRHISYVSVRGESRANIAPRLADRILSWSRDNRIDSVVWTGLPSNFHEKVGKPFTPENGLEYLETLTGKNLRRAVEYLEKAPDFIDTPLRRLVAGSEWWRSRPTGQDPARLVMTIHGPADLLNKLVRSQHRALHARHASHVGDYLYDFCTSALALRDHIFQSMKVSAQDQARFHNEWGRDTAWAACRDIANAFKHLTLQKPSRLSAVRTVMSEGVDVYQSAEGELRLVRVSKPDIDIVWPDGYSMTVFEMTSHIIAKWMEYFRIHDIPFRAQDDSEFFGEAPAT